MRLADLLTAFQETAKSRQVLIQQPDVVGLFYAQNQKRGGYTGFFKNIAKKEKFDLEKFVAVHALPGPGSQVFCHVQDKSRPGAIRQFVMIKDEPCSQIPGYKYNYAPVPTIPRPAEWSQDAIIGSLLSLFKLKKADLGTDRYKEALGRLAGKEVTAMPWDGFMIWAKTFKVYRLEQIIKGPERIRAMMMDEGLKKLIVDYLQE